MDEYNSSIKTPIDLDKIYRNALQLRDQEDIESLNKSIDMFKQIINVGHHWIVNDYALALVKRNDPNDLTTVVNVLNELCQDENSQSIRILGLAYLNLNTNNTNIIGECLLRYSVFLNNKWALYDYINILLERKRPKDRDYILSLLNTQWIDDLKIKEIVFTTALGLNGMQYDYDVVEKIFTLSKNNVKEHCELLKLIIKTKNSIFRDLILTDSMISEPEYK